MTVNLIYMYGRNESRLAVAVIACLPAWCWRGAVQRSGQLKQPRLCIAAIAAIASGNGSRRRTLQQHNVMPCLHPISLHSCCTAPQSCNRMSQHATNDVVV
jgi:hypothetical protein